MLSLTLAALLASPALAEDVEAVAGFEPVLEADVAASYWDEGFKVAVSPGVQAHLWGEPDSLLFGDTFLRFDALIEVTPSYSRAGPRISFSPIAIFEVSGHFLPSLYFGTFSSIKGFDDPDVVYTDDVLDAIDRHPGSGYRYGGDATLQGKVGPVIVASWWEVQRWQISTVIDVGDYFWEPQSELLIAFQDTTWYGNGVVLYEHVFDEARGRKLYAGGVWGMGTSVATKDRWMRSGLLGNFAVDEHWGVLLTVQAYLEDRVYTDPFPPYVATRVRWTM